MILQVKTQNYIINHSTYQISDSGRKILKTQGFSVIKRIGDLDLKRFRAQGKRSTHMVIKIPQSNVTLILIGAKFNV